MLEIEKLMVPIDFHCMETKTLWKSMGIINCSVTNILQNVFFCVQLKKELHTFFKIYF